MFADDMDRILSGKYPGKSHAARVVELLREKVPNAKSYLYLEGRMSKLLEDSDEFEPFRQRRHFYYLTGCDLSNCYLLYDIDSSKSTLFIPPTDTEEVVWSGLPLSPQQALEKFDVDEVKFSTELNNVLSDLSGSQDSTVYTIADQVSSDITFGLGNVDSSILKDVTDRCRVVKDDYEVAMIRKANIISSLGHEAIMKQASKASNEMQLEATFLGHCVARGAKKMAYPPIVAAGRAGAILHYEANDQPLRGNQNLLVDAGAEWNNCASDITRTFPLTGTFTKESRQIYDIVYKMQTECINIIKAGVGNPNFDDKNKYFRYLRPAGSVVTVEPGIYFCEHIIRPYLQDEGHKALINSDVLDKYWDVGGVRIEDNVLVTPTGVDNLTTAIKDPDQLEGMIRGLDGA
ncbi:putative Xaa-Pro aminopeptidase PEPP [Fusarium sp. LHS14.1]|nr:putative Xaa-Pro aminopeptidase PEPP [Fusarium sp. LHS14.1]